MVLAIQDVSIFIKVVYTAGIGPLILAIQARSTAPKLFPWIHILEYCDRANRYSKGYRLSLQGRAGEVWGQARLGSHAFARSMR